MADDVRAPVLMLMGPTASGKTALSIELAQALNGEIISVDSALVYRGMDIGTAKPSLQERAGIPHYLIDIIAPTESFSSGQFRDQALVLIEDSVQRGKLPILVGGTMLYFSALTQGLAQLPPADDAVRARLDALAQQHGNAFLHRRLAQLDPAAAQRIHVNDPQRVQRALEVYELTGKPLSDFFAAQNTEARPYRYCKFSVMPASRAVLHQRIERRVDRMLQQGLLEEVERLRARGDLHAEMPSMRCVGYRQAWACLQGEADMRDLRDLTVFATRQLAKRQLTWLRKEQDIQWLDSETPDLRRQALQRCCDALRVQ
jgi:tRNA dimethylallyltransferase